MQKLIDLIRTALNEVSCEELPSGCDDLSVDMDNSSPEQTVRNQTFVNLIGGNNLRIYVLLVLEFSN